MRVDENGNAWWHWLLGIVAVIALAAVVVSSAVLTGGASLVAMGVGFAAGATANFVSQGVSNLLNGNGFFDNFNWGNVLLGGLTGAAFATGLGGLIGSVGVGIISNIGMSAFEQKTFQEIIFDGIIGGLAAGIGYGLGQVLSKVFNSGNDYGFKIFYDAAKADGASFLKAIITSAMSVWQNYIPSWVTSLSRVLVKYLVGSGRQLINEQKQ